MPQINATVDWPEGQAAASVNPNPIVVPKANGATVIKWTNGDNVTTFAISGLDGSQFNPVASNGQGTSFTTNDANSDSVMTTYLVQRCCRPDVVRAHPQPRSASPERRIAATSAGGRVQNERWAPELMHACRGARSVSE